MTSRHGRAEFRARAIQAGLAREESFGPFRTAPHSAEIDEYRAGQRGLASRFEGPSHGASTVRRLGGAERVFHKDCGKLIKIPVENDQKPAIMLRLRNICRRLSLARCTRDCARSVSSLARAEQRIDRSSTSRPRARRATAPGCQRQGWESRCRWRRSSESRSRFRRSLRRR